MSRTIPIPRPQDSLAAGELMQQLAAAARALAAAIEEQHALTPTEKGFPVEILALAIGVHRRRLSELLAIEKEMLEVAGAIRVQFPNLLPPFVPLHLDVEDSDLVYRAMRWATGADPDFPPSSPAPAALAEVVQLAGRLSLVDLGTRAARRQLILDDAGDAEVLRAALLAHPTLLASVPADVAGRLLYSLGTFLPA